MQAFPAIKLKMGTWRYYSVRMKMSDAASRIKFASEVTGCFRPNKWAAIGNPGIQAIGRWARQV